MRANTVGARSIVPLLNRRNDENGTFYEAIKIAQTQDKGGK